MVRIFFLIPFFRTGQEQAKSHALLKHIWLTKTWPLVNYLASLFLCYVDEISVDEMSVDEMAFDQKTRNHYWSFCWVESARIGTTSKIKLLFSFQSFNFENSEKIFWFKVTAPVAFHNFPLLNYDGKFGNWYALIGLDWIKWGEVRTGKAMFG